MPLRRNLELGSVYVLMSSIVSDDIRNVLFSKMSFIYDFFWMDDYQKLESTKTKGRELFLEQILFANLGKKGRMFFKTEVQIIYK